MQPHPLTNFEIQKCYQNEPKFDSAYSRNELAKIKDGDKSWWVQVNSFVLDSFILEWW